jgi:vacuolar protein sorting-associated protein 18
MISAQFVIDGKQDIQQAMELLQQCDLIKIEDILPFFSDFVTIDHFRDPICNSLQEYNQQIQDLREEMVICNSTRS